MSSSFIQPHGGYKNLKSYQKTLVVHQATVYFCKRFFNGNHRQTDQMVQAARSGKQNIIEGSMASATSKQSEIHLTNVAKASLGELQEDYEDFLREKNLDIWDKEHPQAQYITRLSRQEIEEYQTYQSLIEKKSPEVSANTIRHLIIQTIVILHRQIKHLEQKFLNEGGTREQMTAARLETRAAKEHQEQNSGRDAVSPAPLCPQCNAAMVLRKARKGKNAGNEFWGCSKYPNCRGTRQIDAGTDGQQRGR